MIETLLTAGALALGSVPAKAPEEDKLPEFPDENAVLVEDSLWKDIDESLSDEEFLKMV